MWCKCTLYPSAEAWSMFLSDLGSIGSVRLSPSLIKCVELFSKRNGMGVAAAGAVVRVVRVRDQAIKARRNTKQCRGAAGAG